MYKCLECGHIFEYGEEKDWREPHGEEMSGCPICGSAYEETRMCRQCGGEFLDDELHDGYCVECLREKVTYDTALEYLVAGNLLMDFMLGKFYGCDEVPTKPSEKFAEAMRENYLRMKADDLLCGKFDFLDCIREYIIDDDGECGQDDFAEWLSKRKG